MLNEMKLLQYFMITIIDTIICHNAFNISLQHKLWLFKYFDTNPMFCISIFFFAFNYNPHIR